MRAELNKVAAGYQLTFDTTGYIGNYPIEDATASGGADAVFVMGYDYRSSGSSPVGSIAPSGGPLYDVGDTVRAYTARIPASKVILGVPYYGRAWSTSTDTLNASNISGAKYGSSVTVLYESARDLAITNGRRYDPRRRRGLDRLPARDVHLDLRLRHELAAGLLRGRGLAQGQVRPRQQLRACVAPASGPSATTARARSCTRRIEDKFITDTIPPKIAGSALSSTLVSPNADGRLDTVTASVSATGLDKWGYVVEPMVGAVAGAAIRSGTVADTKPVFTWNGMKGDGTRAADGVYRLTVWTADASDNRAQRQFSVTLDTTPAVDGLQREPDDDLAER